MAEYIQSNNDSGSLALYAGLGLAAGVAGGAALAYRATRDPSNGKTAATGKAGKTVADSASAAASIAEDVVSAKKEPGFLGKMFNKVGDSFSQSTVDGAMRQMGKRDNSLQHKMGETLAKMGNEYIDHEKKLSSKLRRRGSGQYGVEDAYLDFLGDLRNADGKSTVFTLQDAQDMASKQKYRLNSSSTPATVKGGIPGLMPEKFKPLQLPQFSKEQEMRGRNLAVQMPFGVDGKPTAGAAAPASNGMPMKLPQLTMSQQLQGMPMVGMPQDQIDAVTGGKPPVQQNAEARRQAGQNRSNQAPRPRGRRKLVRR